MGMIQPKSKAPYDTLLQSPAPRLCHQGLMATPKIFHNPPKKKPKKHNPNYNHQTLHPSTLQTLITTYNITHSYYSSPLTCPTTLTQYNSPHNRDIKFGSTGLAHSSKWRGNGLARPPDLKTAMTSIQWACMATQTNYDATTIIIINHKENTLPFTHTKLHIIVTIPPNTIQYNPTSKWPKYVHQLEKQYTTIIRIHKHDPPSDNPQPPNAIISNILGLYNINYPPPLRKNNKILQGMASSPTIQPPRNQPPNISITNRTIQHPPP